MLLETVKEYSWDEGSLAMFEIRLTAICHLSAVAQDNIHPNYQIPNIDTNTVLYDGDIEYQNEIRLFIDQVFIVIIFFFFHHRIFCGVGVLFERFFCFLFICFLFICFLFIYLFFNLF